MVRNEDLSFLEAFEDGRVAFDNPNSLPLISDLGRIIEVDL
jgi:hypothetical protein